jgi:hypothetical protein
MARTRVTKKDLREMTTRLNELEGRPLTYSGPEKEVRNGYEVNKINVGHINLDHASCYGGYALREVTNSGGAEDFYYPRWTRISAREMYEFLQGRLYELENPRS